MSVLPSPDRIKIAFCPFYMLNVVFYYFAWQLQSVDENELDIPNGENNAENEEEQEQPEVEEQEFYVEGWFSPSAIYFSLVVLLNVIFCCMSTLIKLVEENVNLKPTDGPSNGQRDEKQEEKKPEEDEACGSEGKVLIS